MRILFVQRHFWPDVPAYAHLTKGIASQLADDGHAVTVLSATPSYNAAYVGDEPPLREMVGGVRVIRMRMPRERSRRTRDRLRDTMHFVGRAVAHLLRYSRSYDTVVVTNAPPVFLAAAVRLISKLTGTNYVYHCQDLHPEAGLISGMVAPGMAARTLLRIDRKSCANAAAVVVLSSDMHDALIDRGVPDRNIHVINNFIIHAARISPDTPTTVTRFDGRFRVIFAGNMGRFQGLDRVISAAHLLADRPEIQFVFLGSGTEVESLKRQAGSLVGETIEFIPHQPGSTAMALLADSQLGVVPLQPGMYRVAYPSKIMAYGEAGCRLLLLMEGTSEPARNAECFDIGTCCDSSEPRLIADAILAEFRRYQEAGEDRTRIRKVARDLFARETILPKWSRLFASLDDQNAPSAAAAVLADDSVPGLAIRPASPADIDRIAAVHAATFPGFTTTSLGPRFLKRYYETVLSYRGHVFLVAEDQRSQVVGFAAGFVSPARFYEAFRQQRWALGRAALPRLIRRPSLIFDVRGGSQWANSQLTPDDDRVAELASIAVDPGGTGRGIGSSLVKRFAAEAFVLGAIGVTLTTDAEDNSQVREFYERLGFRAERSLQRGANRRMVEYRLYPDDHCA